METIHHLSVGEPLHSDKHFIIVLPLSPWPLVVIALYVYCLHSHCNILSLQSKHHDEGEGLTLPHEFSSLGMDRPF